MEYDCPHCSNPFTADPSLAGKVVICPHCDGRVQVPLPTTYPMPPIPQASQPARILDSAPSASLVTITPDGRILADINSVPQARQVIKELRLHKKQLNLQKRQINDQQRVIRSQYTHEVRQRGSKLRGGGKIGRFVRTVQTASRDARRAQLAHELAPLENQKRQIEAVKIAIDQAILRVEEYIEVNS